jgi:hypothetical protein
VHLLTPGLSGAAVYLVTRISHGSKQVSWVAKVADKLEIIDQERSNYENLIHDRLSAAPRLADRGNVRILFFQFASQDGNRNPETLRQGYAKTSVNALEALMERIVQSVKPLHQFYADSLSPIDRMPELEDLTSLEERLKTITPLMSKQLIEGWESLISQKDRCPMVRSKAHGDLNSGNILYQPGTAASSPVIIDFASMTRSKDNQRYGEGFHFPFWDYAKLERDLITRLFLKDAICEGLDKQHILTVVKFVYGSFEDLSQEIKNSNSVAKLVRSLSALRKEIQRTSTPENYDGCYKPVLAYALMTMLFRGIPDTDIQSEIQVNVASHGVVSLLQTPFDSLSSMDPLWSSRNDRHIEERKYLEALYPVSHALSRSSDIDRAIKILRKREAGGSVFPGNMKGNSFNELSGSDRSSYSLQLSQDMIELAILARSRLTLMDIKEYSNQDLLNDYFSKTALKNVDFMVGETVEVFADDIAAGDTQMISDIIWCCSFFAVIDGVNLLWGKAFVNIKNGRSELLLDNRPEAWTGKPVVISGQVIYKLKLPAYSFTRLALELMERTYYLYHNGERRVSSFGGFLKDANLWQFKNEFARHRKARPTASKDELIHLALLDTSFGKARCELGITQFDVRVIWELNSTNSEDTSGGMLPLIVIIVDAKRPVSQN